VTRNAHCRLLTLIAGVLAFHALGQTRPGGPEIIAVSGDIEYVHDPSIIRDGNTWYEFGTANGPHRDGELPIRCSKDLHEWKRCGAVLPQLPEWIQKDSPQTKELWAPDISFFNGEYHLYYAFSVFGKNTSGIALLTNKTLDPHNPRFHWEDRGRVLRSRAEDNFNAIDPNLVLDDKGGAWLAFGSFWDGIKMRRIDPQTGKLSSADTKLYSLARRKRPKNPPPNPPGLPGDWQAIEAPFIVHHGHYFYLFVSYDLCCRGTRSNYKTMVGRATNVTGPYVDAKGVPMLDGGATPVLLANGQWLGPGGESVRMGQEHGLGDDHDIIVFHAYQAKSGDAYLQLSTIDWSGGWPHVALQGGNPANP
jgi:arabinan endo-1,5-alpha-L-arabinosidase